MSTREQPAMPQDLEDALYKNLRACLHLAALDGVIGEDAAFTAVDAVWSVLVDWGGLEARPCARLAEEES